MKQRNKRFLLINIHTFGAGINIIVKLIFYSIQGRQYIHIINTEHTYYLFHLLCISVKSIECLN